MYLGHSVEFGQRDAVFQRPQHPYTEALMNAVPIPDPEVVATETVLSGEVPSPMDPPPGCRFHTPCTLAIAACRSVPPRIKEVAPGHTVACQLRYSSSGGPRPANEAAHASPTACLLNPERKR